MEKARTLLKNLTPYERARLIREFREESDSENSDDYVCEDEDRIYCCAQCNRNLGEEENPVHNSLCDQCEKIYCEKCEPDLCEDPTCKSCRTFWKKWYVKLTRNRFLRAIFLK